MTINELKEALSELDIKVENMTNHTYLKDSKERTIAVVHNQCVSIIDTRYAAFMALDDHRKNKILKILTEYATTPIEEREENEKYYWKIKFDNYITLGKYLKVRLDNKWTVSDEEENDHFKTKLTEEEYKKMVEDNFIPDIFKKEEIK